MITPPIATPALAVERGTDSGTKLAAVSTMLLAVPSRPACGVGVVQIDEPAPTHRGVKTLRAPASARALPGPNPAVGALPLMASLPPSSGSLSLALASNTRRCGAARLVANGDASDLEHAGKRGGRRGQDGRPALLSSNKCKGSRACMLTHPPPMLMATHLEEVVGTPARRRVADSCKRHVRTRAQRSRQLWAG